MSQSSPTRIAIATGIIVMPAKSWKKRSATSLVVWA